MAGFKMADRKKVLRAIRALRKEGLRYRAMAEKLNEQGFTRPSGEAWTENHLNTFCNAYGIKTRGTRKTRSSSLTIHTGDTDEMGLIQLIVQSSIDGEKKSAMIRELLK